MLTRGHAKRVAVRPELAPLALPPLPLPLVLAVLLRLPLDQRLLAALVSRAFRAAVADASLWRSVSLAPGCGVAGGRVSDALLRAVSAKAAGGMVELDVGEQVDLDPDGPIVDQALSRGAVADAVAANSRSLRRLNVVNTGNGGTHASAAAVAELAASAPALAALHADVSCTAGPQALGLLRNEAPFGPLRVVNIAVDWRGQAWQDDASVLALAAGCAAHPSLKGMFLVGAPLQADGALVALVDAAIARRFTSVCLLHCALPAAAEVALARLLRDGGDRLEALVLSGAPEPLPGAAFAPAFCLHLRACRLTELALNGVRLWEDAAVGEAVVAAVVGHHSIRTLGFGCNFVDVEDEPAAGASLAHLLAANSPVLRELDVRDCSLCDAGMRPIVAALRGCTFLRVLNCGGNSVSTAFARGELLPAVTAAASLRLLYATQGEAEFEVAVAELTEAEALVAARRDVDA